mgnify:CR=1 FL=1
MEEDEKGGQAKVTKEGIMEGAPQQANGHHPSLQRRRLDSLAVLLQGDNVCAAALFDGRSHLVLATNACEENALVTAVITFLKVTVQAARRLSGDLEERAKNRSSSFRRL